MTFIFPNHTPSDSNAQEMANCSAGEIPPGTE